MDGILDGLNRAQREAVTATEGYVRVLAGAGSGKTRALAHRFAYLVNEMGVLPGSILCATFTNKSANEMRRRIHSLTGDNDTGYVCTFHSFCVSVLQEDSHAVQYPKSFLVLDNADIDAMLRLIYEERGLTLRHMTFQQARDRIEMRKLFQEPHYYRDLISLPLDRLYEAYQKAVDPFEIIFYGYLYQEKKCFGLDYNDLIILTLHMFEEDEAIRLKWQQRLEYVMVDEFQDIDLLQHRLMTALCGYHRNLFVVGDPDQTIYTWRGANVKYLTEFDLAFPGTRTILMMENYRSTPQVLAAANALIAKNRDRVEKELIPTLPGGEPPLCYHAPSQQAEAAWVAARMEELRAQGAAYRDMAVLYRAHYLTRPLEEALRREKIPYTIFSGAAFFERREVKDALSYLRMVAYRDDLSFLRVANTPKRNLGERRMAFLRAFAAEHGCSLFNALAQNLEHEVLRGTRARAFAELVERFSNYAQRSISELLAALLDESGYSAMLRTEGSQERLDNLAELEQSVHEYETTCGEEATLENYLAHVALFTNSDADPGRDQVRLMTVHTAKGLEFPYVFLCGMNEGIFPSKKVKTRAAMEEERRLAFVAVTRAARGLFLSEAAGRNLDGTPRYPSRFLLDIGKEHLSFWEDPPAYLWEETGSHVAQTDRFLDAVEARFAPGGRVRHSIFGEGTVLELDPSREAYLIQFDSVSTPRRLSFRAKLEPSGSV